MKKLHLDIETYSSVDLKKSGVYKYVNSPDFEIMLIAFAFDNDEVNVIDLMNEEAIPNDVVNAFTDPKIIKCAHNANFERVCFSKYGYEIPAEQWECTAIKSAFCGYPLKLADVSEILDLGDKGKLNIGKDLIKYFCVPCKPTKVNNNRYRNLPYHSPEKWMEFKQYVKNDVIAEREIDDILKDYEIPEWEKLNYVLDQKINDLGVKIDIELVKNAVCFSDIICENIVNDLKEHGIANPRSVQQILAKINDSLDTPISSLDKNSVRVLLKDTSVLNEYVVAILKSRVVLSKTSNKKYEAMQMCSLHGVHESKGLFQFYGAGRTGRWAGRLIQLQNLPRNSMPDF
jgi:DNA polymerase